MPRNIQDPETERLAVEMAELTGESKTGAVRAALRERKARLLVARSGGGRAERKLAARMGLYTVGIVDALVGAADAVVIEFDPDHWREAIRARSRFGRGRHAAGLDLGDCLTYAAARVSGLPLLAKGDGFARTDLGLA